MKNLYSKLLVFLQFSTIGVMLLLAHYRFDLLSILVFSIGAVVGLWALTHNRLGNFNIEPELRENCELVTTGIYRWIRHPMYASVTLMMLGVALMDPSAVQWLLWLFLVNVLLLKAQREESLWLSHDPCYLEYRGKTKYFIPYIL
ncbi:methyltransferase family protein [Sulfurovum lithotrophicum]|uniref:methyltransferase family protein n=1 Tax=Sulfurovum lithotrophicum TaxID=206403 RepID=UPI0006975AFC|nr:isoprenylcysteine carboxylmethyltransferase family protein [Sulfurovum lithotrophicum]